MNVDTVAAQLGISTRSVYRLHDVGHMPAAIKLGALVRWSREAIVQWVKDGCPKRRPKRR